MSSTILPVCPKTGSTSPSLTVHLCLHTAPGNRECALTDHGAQIAMLYVRLYTRALRPVASLTPHMPDGSPRGRQAFDRVDAALATYLEEVKLAA